MTGVFSFFLRREFSFSHLLHSLEREKFTILFSIVYFLSRIRTSGYLKTIIGRIFVYHEKIGSDKITDRNQFMSDRGGKNIRYPSFKPWHGQRMVHVRALQTALSPIYGLLYYYTNWCKTKTALSGWSALKYFCLYRKCELVDLRDPAVTHTSHNNGLRYFCLMWLHKNDSSRPINRAYHTHFF